MPWFRRYQSAVPNRRGEFPGVFALANGLASEGRLAPADHEWWVTSNRRCESLYPDPSMVISTCYDRDINPGARSWFKDTATELLAVTADYLALLDRYGVPWAELRSSSVGRLVYEDAVQVVAVPYSYPADWALTSGAR